MGNYSEDIVLAARSRIGFPFRHHFKPEDLCEGGRNSVAACMERGMDNKGYDCSGLMIACICDVLGLSPPQWPRDFRHIKQLEELARTESPEPGDTVLFYPESIKDKPSRTHLGIFVVEQCVIHASGISEIVEEGKVEGVFSKVNVISSSSLIGLVSQAE